MDKNFNPELLLEKNKGPTKDLGYTEKAKPLRVEEGSIKDELIRFVSNNLPIIKRSDVVHHFQNLGYSRTYIYSQIQNLLELGYLQAQEDLLSLPSIVKKLIRIAKKNKQQAIK